MDGKIAATTALAALLWPAGLALVILDLMTGIQTGELGLYLAGAGGVLTIRGFFCEMRQRERDAYRLGEEAGVRSIR